jgi:hypothetical protein
MVLLNVLSPWPANEILEGIPVPIDLIASSYSFDFPLISKAGFL